MSKAKTFKPKITRILHVCMVVKNIDKAIQTYEEVYGIGPWILGGREDIKYLPGTTYVHGKQVDFEGRIAGCHALNVALELIQPMDEKSHYAEFLQEHGEGMHHMMVEIANKEDFVEIVESRGNEVLFQGFCAMPPFTEKILATYYDMRKDLGFICEIAPDPAVPIKST